MIAVYWPITKKQMEQPFGYPFIKIVRMWEIQQLLKFGKFGFQVGIFFLLPSSYYSTQGRKSVHKKILTSITIGFSWNLL